jgi:predicted amidohydrolase YtcJ
MTTGQPRLPRRAVLGGLATALAGAPATGQSTPAPDLVLHNGRIATLDRARPRVAAAAVRGGEILALGEDRDVVPLAGPETRVVDLRGRAAIPGLNDSHTHPIRGGLHYNMELRWDGVRSLADGMRMLPRAGRAHAAAAVGAGGRRLHRAPVRRKALPSLDELNAAAPDTPVFILRLYDRALLNRAALRAVGYTRDTPAPPGSRSSGTRAASPLASSWPSPTPSSSTTPSTPARSCRPNTRRTRRATSCAS